MREASGVSFRYQIGSPLLILGATLLSLWLALLIAVAETSSVLWWGMTVGVVLVLGVVVTLLWGRSSQGPAEVRFEAEALLIPRGLFGARHDRVSLCEVTAVRLVGRAALLHRQREREAVYVVVGEGYVVLMSELFADAGSYDRFRAELIHRVRAARSDVRVDIDGIALG